MRQIGGRSLWIGNAGDLRDPRALLAAGVEAVVVLAHSEPLAPFPRDLVHCRFPLSDGGDNPAWLLRLAIQTVAALLQAKVPTAVCCSYGQNRSVCVVAGALSLAEGQSLEESLLATVQSGPADVSPGLWAQTRQAVGSGDANI